MAVPMAAPAVAPLRPNQAASHATSESAHFTQQILASAAVVAHALAAHASIIRPCHLGTS